MVFENLNPSAGRVPQLFTGQFADDYDAGEPAHVILDAFGDVTHGPCYWQPQPGLDVSDNVIMITPSRGDSCLVGIDDARIPWIVSWWPYG